MLSIIRQFSMQPQLGFIAVIAFLLAILIAIVTHEQAHGLVAYWNGDHTAKFLGRLSLNPFKHLDLMGTLCMVFVGFGWAKPVPIDSRNFKNYKKGMITVSLAGVTMNLLNAILFASVLAIYLACTQSIQGSLLIYVGQTSITFAQYANFFFKSFLQLSITFNLTLMAFNLLPLYPLDGFRIVETLAKPRNRYVNFMYSKGQFVLFGVLIASSLLGMLNPYLDIIGLYISGVNTLMSKLFELIFQIPLF
ncbi:MAG: site-2 protease family protein [Clostridia bacterium]